jgi:hypothetical protein
MKRVWMLLFLVACADRVLGPEDPVWGKQACAHCAMLVSEKAAAAQAVTAEGKRKFFDDPGCLIAWEDREHPQLKGQWVRLGDGWVDAKATRYSSGHVTPMDFGFLADAQGLSYEEVSAAVKAKAQQRPGGL